jgi:toxin ParE1/3/4
MIVVITEAAEADVEAIGDWIAADNPARALTFVLELCDRCRALADMPRAYRWFPAMSTLAFAGGPITTI